MGNFIGRLLDLGVEAGATKDDIGKLRIVNAMSLLSCLSTIIMLLITIVNVSSREFTFFLFGISISTSLPLILNKLRHPRYARNYFVISAYSIVVALSVLLGPNLNYHYFLFGGIGIPLYFISSQYKFQRVFMALLALPIWFYLQWHFNNFQPYIILDSSYLEWVKYINVSLAFLTVFATAFVFIKENDGYVKEVLKNTEDLKTLNKQLEQFAYSVSHDLKAPIGNVFALIQYLREEEAKNISTEGLEVFQMIEQSSQRSMDMISAILEYSRLSAGLISIKNFELQEVLEELKQTITVPKHLSFDMPAYPLTMKGVRIQLVQVFANFLSNAMKYNKTQGGWVKVEILTLDENWLEIHIKDNGPGISKELQGEIFNLFSTANKEERNDSTGIGLAIVKRLVEQNKGSVGVNSIIGEGSDFWFKWPIDQTELRA
jgi:signal transduction histidine kinase